ncbi:2-dehydropantoate 2-reductase [Xylariaceae sp. FL1651]|nr:2-dehydropantoate 2-reductase [Xylariaceae sp. FL1651]
MAPRVLVFGTGSLGSVYAWLLSRAIPESNITAICRSNYDVASQHGLTINSVVWGSDLRVRPHVVRSVSEAASQSQVAAQPFDYILVTAKALPTTPSTAELIRPAITPGTTAIVLVQNGIGIEEEYARLYAGDDVPILSAVAYMPATQTAPGVVAHTETIEHLHIGTYPAFGVPETHKRAARVFVDLLKSAGAGATLYEDVQAQRWSKLLVNASWNPVCALTRLRDRQFMESSKGKGRGPSDEDEAVCFVRDVMLEIASVAQAYGYDDINEERVDFQMGRAKAREMPGVEPSMLADALEGKPLEVDAIVGNVYRLAKEKGIPVPMLRAVYLLAQGLSASFSSTK